MAKSEICGAVSVFGDERTCGLPEHDDKTQHRAEDEYGVAIWGGPQ